VLVVLVWVIGMKVLVVVSHDVMSTTDTGVIGVCYGLNQWIAGIAIVYAIQLLGNTKDYSALATYLTKHDPGWWIDCICFQDKRVTVYKTCAS